MKNEKDENEFTISSAADDSDVKPVSAGKKKKSKSTVIVLIVLLAALVCCIVYIFGVVFNNIMAKKSYGELSGIAAATDNRQADDGSDGSVNVAENDDTNGFSPIDLPKLKKINSDVYAWIRIPNTYVDYPIAQSTIEDNYYLHRSIYKRYLFAGMIYTQSCNKRDFSDPVTVIYGHNMRSTTMFSSLHYFEKEDFFNKNEFFTIYTLDGVLTYRIISAFKYDNRHIMNSFDFSNPKVLANFQQFILNPTSVLRHVRSGVTLNEDSKLVVLSTCMSNDKKSRFLVIGELTSNVQNEQETQ